MDVLHGDSTIPHSDGLSCQVNIRNDILMCHVGSHLPKGCVVRVCTDGEVFDGNADVALMCHPSGRSLFMQPIQNRAETLYIPLVVFPPRFIVHFFATDVIIKAGQGGERSEYFRPMQQSHLWVPSAENIISMYGALQIDDVRV